MASPPQAPIRILVYLLRRDLRLADNPIFHELSRLQKQSHRPFTHLLPLYVFPAEQVEVSGFVKQDEKSPYPEARSQVGGFWRTGRLRSKFLAESVWDLKEDLRKIESDLVVRVGSMGDAVSSVLEGLREQKGTEIHGVWMTKEEGWEEQYQDRGVRAAVKEDQGEEFKMWTDEKYFVDDRDLPFDDPRHLSDVFTNFRKTVEPLRAAPRQEFPKPSILPPLPSNVPPSANPFTIPDTLDETIKALHKPINPSMGFQHMPNEMPKGVQNAHPFSGGSKSGHQRIQHLIESGAMTSYKDTRNGLLGLDFSTKLSAWLAHGSITARQIHWALMEFEDGKGDLGRNTQGYGGGENKGTAGVRFELLWRDYMRLCTRKFGTRLFFLDGYKSDSEAGNKFISSPFSASTAKRNQNGANNGDTRAAVERFLQGRTGIGLIDASQRELFLTGWTSNRARQNVASFLAKHLGIDWRLGAEWYETNLIDYDLSSNWGNWQYVAGVGNDPRGDARVFNPVKQAVDYDTNGEYVRSWVPELRDVGRRGQGEQNGGVPLPGEKQQGQGSSMEDLMGVFQAWRMPDEEKKRLGLQDVEWVQKPLIRINFSVNRRGGGDQKRGGGGGGGGGPGGSGGGGFRGKGRGRGSGKPKTEGGRNARSGTMEKAGWQ